MSLVLGVIALAIGAYGYLWYHSFFEQSAAARIATQSASLKAGVAGKVSKVFVKETQTVKAGDPLVQIDPGDIQSRLNQQQQELARTEDRLKGGQIYLTKMRESLSAGDQAAQEKYKGARNWYYKLQAKTQELRNEVARTQAELKSTLLTAPADGHVAKTLVQPGRTVASGEALLSFVGNQPPWIEASFKEQQLEKMRPGQRVEISVPQLGKTYAGTVQTMPPVPENIGERSKLEKLIAKFMKSGTQVPVRIAFDPTTVKTDVNKLTDGTEASARVYIKEENRAPGSR